MVTANQTLPSMDLVRPGANGELVPDIDGFDLDPEYRKGVASVSRIREALNYPQGDRSKDHFWRSIYEYRLKHRFPNDRTVTTTLDLGNRHIVKSFVLNCLERDGHGALFWPDHTSSPNYNSLQYSRDATL